MKLAIALTAALMGVAALPASARNVEAGPIWSQSDAKMKCPVLAAKWHGTWTGHWWTTVSGEMSVCQITNIPTKAVRAGPLWNQQDAERKCTALARAEQATWTGHWWTTQPGKMSVCQLDYN